MADDTSTRKWAVPAAIGAGLLAAAIGTWIWVAANYSIDFEMGWLAIPIGAAIGAVVSLASGRRRRAWVAIVAVAMAIVATFFSQNFLQRELLYDGIDALQGEWETMRIDAPSDGDPDELAAMRPEGEFIVPPPAIVKVMPPPGYETMEPEVLAIVWDDVPEEILAGVRDLYPDKVVRAEEIIASGELPDLEVDPSQAPGAAPSGGQTLEEAQARYEASEEEYDIPKPVAECATPPDFTQPDAKHGLGFGDGVPLVLPLADVLNDPPERGDGQEYDTPSPFCFGRENAKDQPVETVSWVIAILMAGLVSYRMGRRPDDLPAEESASA